jgi:hypothetical protein
MHGQITARRLAAAGASLAVLAVAACGSATGGSTGPRAGTGTGHPPATATAPPAGALCALPRTPGGMRCPAALGGALRLEFTAPGRSYPPVLIRDSGCASVSGVGPVRQWAWSSRPGRLLSEAAGSYGRLLAGTHPSSVPTP